MDQFGELSRLGETDGVETLPDGPGKKLGRGDRGAARRVEKQKVPPGLGRAALRNDFHLQPRERPDENFGLGDGGGGQDKLRLRAVVGADPPQAPQHLGHVAAHDAPVGVDFIDHHELEPGKKAGPRGVVRHKPHVEHVRVGDEHMRRVRLDGLALRRRRVAVINGRGQGRGGQGRVQLLEGLQLVLLQGLQGKQIQGVAPGFGQERFQYRQIIDQRLAAGRGGGHQQVLPRPDGGQGLPLVGVEPGNPQTLQGRQHHRRQPRIPHRVLHRLLRQIMIMTENIPVFSGFFQLIDEILEHLCNGFRFSVFGFR